LILLWLAVAAVVYILRKSVRRMGLLVGKGNNVANERDLGRLEEGLRNIEKAMDRADQSRKQLYEKIDNIDTKVTLLEQQVGALSTGLNEVKPTVAEYLRAKEQVRGAGALGRALWLTGGFVLAGALWLYQNFTWLFNRPS
jgi:septal ring factor EnvC (AmiA/AmiB activator)